MGLSTGSGVRQWVFQRFANLLLIIFSVVLALIVLCNSSYEAITGLLSQTWFQVYLIVTLVIGCLNSVLAGWQIAGDYAAKFHVPDAVIIGVCALVTLVYFILGMMLIV